MIASCRYCEAPLRWGCRAGQWMPLNADGSQHYCTGRQRHWPDVNHTAGEPIAGAQYVPSCGECAVPPWEECPCSARLAA
jgi:hypothetical protein